MTPDREERLFETIGQIGVSTAKTATDVHYILNDMKVNGSVGLESILRCHQEKINDLVNLTAQARAKRKLIRDIKEYVKLHPIMSSIGGLLFAGASTGMGMIIKDFVIKNIFHFQ